jgi:L-alanine-DL-glutamate epimerase-like enolase superfamily enzyme
MRRHASEINRIDVLRGGITGATKMAAICEAFGLRCELHMSGFGNLQVLGATTEDVCEYYERGLLGPGVDYDATPRTRPGRRDAPKRWRRFLHRLRARRRELEPQNLNVRGFDDCGCGRHAVAKG